jgi:hypothetical protein
MRSILLGCLIVPVLAGTAGAHATLRYPTPRTEANKAGPCGSSGSTRGSNVTSLDPGTTITVVWDETVDHPGHYRLAFDDDGNDFVNPNNPDDNFATTLMEPIADKSGGRYEQQITLPNIECSNCTLQLIQVMTTSIPYNSFYFQCADITLVPGGGSGTPPDEVESDVGGCLSAGRGGEGWLVLVVGGLAVLRHATRRRARRCHRR